MKYLISLPENCVDSFHDLASIDKEIYYCSADPAGTKVGSGGGAAWLLQQAWKEFGEEEFIDWLSQENKVIIHGGGQSRRLPAYAPMGKLLLPIPVYRWERGQRLNQTLLDLQLPLLNRIMNESPESSHTLIASGDVLISSTATVPEIPDADIVCFGLNVDPALASNHGVFVTKRTSPDQFEYMLQKPDTEMLRNLARDSLFYIDVGIWLFSDRAIELLMRKSGWNSCTNEFINQVPDFYDLYSSFGLALGKNPTFLDNDISELSVAIRQIPKGEFYHFGTSPEIIASSLALQNKVSDQKEIWTKNIKPHPAIFIQNSKVDIQIDASHAQLWIENSHIGSDWTLNGNQLLTGIPENSWDINLPEGVCLDIIPLNDGSYIVRPYGIDDAFRGDINDKETKWLNQPINKWFEDHNLSLDQAGLNPCLDLQDTAIFPLLSAQDDLERVIKWMLHFSDTEGRELWLNSKRLSATEISATADLISLEAQRSKFRSLNWRQLAANYDKSIFFQIDLDHAAGFFSSQDIKIPDSFAEVKDPLLNTHKAMFLSRVERYKGQPYIKYKVEAFNILQDSLLNALVSKKSNPVKNVFDDQIVWSRSPVRIDLAGGWTDTPPYSVLAGGNVVNISLELNGQPPLQAFIRPHKDHDIILRSIDLGEREVIRNFADLEKYTTVGSPFAIPKAALCLAGFHPSFSTGKYKNLSEQLNDFGCGLEISFLAAIPKGSGMGTSSILASTILGAISDFCSLDWDHFEICNRTLALEQLLTTGGGWQDQYGGIVPGVKLLQTEKGWNQTAKIRWLPERLFVEPEYHSSMLLYYTGITRVAKNILEDIVEAMFLNERDRISILNEMKIHALDTWESIQLGDFKDFGSKIKKSWILNNQLDKDTSNPHIEGIIAMIDDLSLGYKLPGAGGGGYLYIVAKDTEAAHKIKKRLEANPPNSRARFVDMKISNKGMQVSRS